MHKQIKKSDKVFIDPKYIMDEIKNNNSFYNSFITHENCYEDYEIRILNQHLEAINLLMTNLIKIY